MKIKLANGIVLEDVTYWDNTNDVNDVNDVAYGIECNITVSDVKRHIALLHYEVEEIDTISEKGAINYLRDIGVL